jgi:hypothetical protein
MKSTLNGKHRNCLSDVARTSVETFHVYSHLQFGKLKYALLEIPRLRTKATEFFMLQKTDELRVFHYLAGIFTSKAAGNRFGIAE